jgi:hypothetical protein
VYKKRRHIFHILVLAVLCHFLQPAIAKDGPEIIQKPIINVPAIAVPGDSIILEYDLPDTESLIFVSLLYRDREVEVTFRDHGSRSDLGYRQLVVDLPENLFYALYDIQVYGSSPASIDQSENALYVIPDYKEKYTFIQVTDTHLPSHLYWGDDGVEADSSEMDDFREVIRDINIINPAFVLHTGDLINDGELEALGIPAISRARKILGEFEVPVFMVPGNHDLGGWDQTPAPDGTARRAWWQYFGWEVLNTTEPGARKTQDYVFRYGKHSFIGLESYVNYDRWREDIYGYQGFINSQLQWLDGTLQEHGDAAMKVLFYHYDFEEQLDLQQLGVDAAFWGHRHYNIGNVNVHPLDLGTAAVCDGGRWYRIVKVENNSITRTWSIQAGDNGEIISENYSPDGLSVTLNNQSVMDFEDCLVTFTLEEGYVLDSLENAGLYQIDSLSTPKIVYALTDLPAQSSVEVSMHVSDIPTDVLTDAFIPEPELHLFPNPFNPVLTIGLDLPYSATVRTEILDLQGRNIDILEQEYLSAGTQHLHWDASGQPTGLYLVRCECITADRKEILMKKALLLK